MVTQKIVATPPRTSLFLVLTIDEGAEAGVRDVLTGISGFTRSVGFRRPDGGLINVVGIGAAAWDRLFTAPRPRHLHPFVEQHGEKHTAPRTPGDLLFHIRGGSTDICFELARLLMAQLKGLATIVDEVSAFKYFDQRDVLGFVDGTENPEGEDAYEAVLTTGDGQYDGGSYVLVQKYLHDMQAWESISVEEQERVIGRTKTDDVEFSEDTKPSNSHIALNDVSDDEGNDLDILRYNMVFGDFRSDEMGTYFIGYAKDPAVTERMLENMFIGDPPGNYDRILDFSTAETGGLFYCPSVELLDEIDALYDPEHAGADRGSADAEPADDSSGPAADEAGSPAGSDLHSLNIGGLKP